MDRIITSSRDRTSLLSTHKVLRKTYFMLSLTLAFSAITATASTVLMLPSPGLILTLVGMYGLMFLTYKTADKPVGILSAFAFTGFLGYILGPILNAYLSAGMGDVIAPFQFATVYQEGQPVVAMFGFVGADGVVEWHVLQAEVVAGGIVNVTIPADLALRMTTETTVLAILN